MELLAMAVGPALAVLGSAYIGKLWLLCVAAALCAVAALCWLPLPRGERQLNPGSVAKTVGELRLGWSLLIHNRPVVLLVSINFSINLAFATALSVNAAVVTDIFKAPESSFALLNTLVGVTGLLNLMLVPTLLNGSRSRPWAVSVSYYSAPRCWGWPPHRPSCCTRWPTWQR
ncbi:hypothetical protein Shyd_71800 [Streptomyces hydrogenans]|uniref:Major facilitator superfamily (MFS) profile domain-containing protein n=1 Tax=Streptomyces hydrogenans TaxID=1873719 RepID=A0ABQ3PLA6_9ACTN|nr:hypothetical protein Shyd_71800 [Streptomyces hydrogenans]